VTEIQRRVLGAPYTIGDMSAAQLWDFWVSLLRALRLLDINGSPIGLAGFVSHSDVFPANFALAYLIMAGDLQAFTEPFDPERAPISLITSADEMRKSREEKKLQLLNLLAYLLTQNRTVVTTQRSLQVAATLLV